MDNEVRDVETVTEQAELSIDEAKIFALSHEGIEPIQDQSN